MSVSCAQGFDIYQRDVEGRMEADADFRGVEVMINHSPLTDDEKAALWLLAWSLREPAAQRRDARATVALITAGTAG